MSRDRHGFRGDTHAQRRWAKLKIVRSLACPPDRLTVLDGLNVPLRSIEINGEADVVHEQHKANAVIDAKLRARSCQKCRIVFRVHLSHLTSAFLHDIHPVP